MSEPMGHAGTEESLPAGSVSVVRVVGAALLIAVAMVGTFYWLITFDWLYFPALVGLVVGAYLLFTGATGADRA